VPLIFQQRDNLKFRVEKFYRERNTDMNTDTNTEIETNVVEPEGVTVETLIEDVSIDGMCGVY
jgi:mycofactocin precursor